MRFLTTCILLATVTQSAAAQDNKYVPQTDLPSRTQIVAVYFGQSECAPCKTPELKNALHRLKPLLKAEGIKRGRDFSVIGVALDWDFAAGTHILEPIAEWDEVSIGANWTNTMAVRYIWQDSTATAALPQVLILERSVSAGEKGISIGPDRTLKRLIGAGAIESWVKQGAPLP